MEKVDRLLHIAWPQAAGNNQLADAVDDAGPGLHPLPVKSPPAAAALPGRRRIKQDARNHAGAEAMRLKKQVAVFRDMNFLHSFALVGLVRLNQAGRNRIPSHSTIAGRVENLRRPRPENPWPRRSIGEPPVELATELRALVTMQLHGCKTQMLCRIAHLIERLVHENANFLQTLRYLFD